jgi:hypothetical protein
MDGETDGQTEPSREAPLCMLLHYCQEFPLCCLEEQVVDSRLQLVRPPLHPLLGCLIGQVVDSRLQQVFAFVLLHSFLYSAA